MACTQERQLCRAKAQYVCFSSILQFTSYLWPLQKDAQTDPVTGVKRSSSGGFLHAADADIPMVTERRRKSRPWLHVDDNEESVGAQAD